MLVKNKKLPLSIIKETYDKTLTKGERLLQIETFQDTFGSKMKRKRPNLGITDIDSMMKEVTDKSETYDAAKDVDLTKHVQAEFREAHRHSVFDKGTSRRIWEELYKVIDSSDVLIHVLDARNPNGTRSKFLEDYFRKNCPNKHLVFVLNKCDLVPTSIT